jgi:hypothetical protein
MGSLTDTVEHDYFCEFVGVIDENGELILVALSPDAEKLVEQLEEES